MATYYVSKNGNNANNGTSLATAKRTLWDAVLAGAHEVATDGDTILFDDGVYTGWEFELAAGNGYMSSIKALTYDSVNPYGATLASTSVTGGVYKMTGPFADKTVTFGKITLTGDGITPNYGIQFSPTSGPATIVLNETKIGNTVFTALEVAPANTVQVIVSANKPELRSARCAYRSPNLGTNSSITLSEPTCIVSGKTQAVGCIYIKATGAGVSATILEPKIVVDYASSFPVQADYGINILNIDNALVYKPFIEATTASVNGTIDAIGIHSDTGTLTAHRGRIMGGEIHLDTNGGIGCVIGADASTAGDNLSNNGIIQGVKLYGSDRWKANTGHAFMVGYCQDGIITGNEAHNIGIGLLFKATTNSKGMGNKVHGASAAHCEFKGATNCSFDGNEFYVDGVTAGAIVSKLNNNSGNQASVGCTANGNLIVIREGFTGTLVDIAATEGTTLSKNIYAIAANATIPATAVATVQGVVYDTIDDFRTAVDPLSTRTTYMPDSKDTLAYVQVAPNVYLPI